MHLAVVSSEETNSGRSVRYLMIKGANKNICNNNDMTPYDLID